MHFVWMQLCEKFKCNYTLRYQSTRQKKRLTTFTLKFLLKKKKKVRLNVLGIEITDFNYSAKSRYVKVSSDKDK